MDELGIYHTGAGWEKEHVKPTIVSIKGFKVGFIAYVDKSTNPRTEFFPNLLINYFEPDKVIDDIESIKGKVDKIICSVHWGMDYSRFFTNKQQLMARKFIDAGADIIMGHHPHTYQPYEVYKDGVIFYSLGQLCFGDFLWEGKQRALKRKTKRGVIVKFKEDFTNFDLIPTKELVGNYIIIPNTNIERRFKFLGFLNKLKLKYKFINIILNMKESYLDRLFEYFFGYYRNPIKQLFSLNNFKKIKFMHLQYKKYKQS